MTDYSTTIHGPTADAPSTTGKVALCKVCGSQWQVKSESGADTRGCAFCGAPKKAIVVSSET